MPALPNPWIILGGVLAAIGIAVSAFFYGGHVERLEWEAVVAKQQAEAASLLAEKTAEVLKKERLLQDLSDEIEKDHQAHADEIAAKSTDLSRLAGELDRLRDDARRGAGRCGPGEQSSAPAGKPTARAAAPELPGSYSELARIAADADRAAEYARTCHAWVVSLGAKK